MPFIEDFTNNNAGWANFNSSGFATYNSTGGPDGGAYVSGPRTFNGLTPGNTTIASAHGTTIRGTPAATRSSAIGNSGARNVSAWVKHDIPVAGQLLSCEPLVTANFPGHVYVEGLGAIPIPGSSSTEYLDPVVVRRLSR